MISTVILGNPTTTSDIAAVSASESGGDTGISPSFEFVLADQTADPGAPAATGVVSGQVIDGGKVLSPGGNPLPQDDSPVDDSAVVGETLSTVGPSMVAGSTLPAPAETSLSELVASNVSPSGAAEGVLAGGVPAEGVPAEGVPAEGVDVAPGRERDSALTSVEGQSYAGQPQIEVPGDALQPAVSATATNARERWMTAGQDLTPQTPSTATRQPVLSYAVEGAVGDDKGGAVASPTQDQRLSVTAVNPAVEGPESLDKPNAAGKDSSGEPTVPASPSTPVATPAVGSVAGAPVPHADDLDVAQSPDRPVPVLPEAHAANVTPQVAGVRGAVQTVAPQPAVDLAQHPSATVLPQAVPTTALMQAAADRDAPERDLVEPVPVRGGGSTAATPVNGALSAVAQPNTAPAQAGPVRTDVMTYPPGHPQWNNELATRVSVMTREGVTEAKLKLHPAELGPIGVRITTEGDRAVIVFHAHHGGTRDAIEAAMPRLRDMMEQGGLQLAHGSVTDNPQSQYGRGSEAQYLRPDIADDGLFEAQPDPGFSSPLSTAAVFGAGIDYYA